MVVSTEFSSRPSSERSISSYISAVMYNCGHVYGKQCQSDVVSSPFRNDNSHVYFGVLCVVDFGVFL